MPTPTEAPPWARRMALDFTERQAFHAKSRSARVASSTASPAARVHWLGSSPSAWKTSASMASSPPSIWRSSQPATSGAGASSRRMFFLRDRISTAPSSYPGATTTSVKISATCSAIATLTGRLVAMTPPKALSESQAWALRWASAMSEPVAMPQGLECLMTATHGSSKSKAARRAELVST